MSNETTSRDVIRREIDRWNAEELTGCVGVLWDRLAERIEEALFGMDEDDERVIEEWAVGEFTARQELRAEVRDVLRFAPPVGNVVPERIVTTIRGGQALARNYPRIAAILRKAEESGKE